MPRPKVFHNLAITTVQADRHELALARRRGLNISQIFRDALASALRRGEKRHVE